MNNRSARLLLGLFLLSSAAFAVECPKVDYVEAKDWSVAELEVQVCAAANGKKANFLLSSDAAKGRDPANPVAMMYMDKSDVCQRQEELYVRILKNVHHRERPSCASNRPYKD